MEALWSIGEQLRQSYGEELDRPLPEQLQTLVRQLATAERRSKKT